MNIKNVDVFSIILKKKSGEKIEVENFHDQFKIKYWTWQEKFEHDSKTDDLVCKEYITDIDSVETALDMFSKTENTLINQGDYSDDLLWYLNCASRVKADINVLWEDLLTDTVGEECQIENQDIIHNFRLIEIPHTYEVYATNDHVTTTSPEEITLLDVMRDNVTIERRKLGAVISLFHNMTWQIDLNKELEYNVSTVEYKENYLKLKYEMNFHPENSFTISCKKDGNVYKIVKESL